MNSACYSFFDSKEYLVTFKQIFDKINVFRKTRKDA